MTFADAPKRSRNGARFPKLLFVMDRDGGNLRALSSNVEHDNTPWPMPDGRILFGRWEYVDRNALVIQSLWTVLPDGMLTGADTIVIALGGNAIARAGEGIIDHIEP